MRPPGWPILAILLHARVGLPLASLFSYSSMRQASCGHRFRVGRTHEMGRTILGPLWRGFLPHINRSFFLFSFFPFFFPSIGPTWLIIFRAPLVTLVFV